MAIEVFDSRTEFRNVIITPDLRVGFFKIEPGQEPVSNTHDLAHEALLILQGRAEVEIDGHQVVAGPGQMVGVKPDQHHSLKVIGDEPVIFCLSVAPHVEPTHTWWDESGNKLPPDYGHSTAADREQSDPSKGKSTERLADEHAAAAQALERAATENADRQRKSAEAVKAALQTGDQEVARATVDKMWGQMYQTYVSVRSLVAAWNELSSRFPLESDE